MSADLSLEQYETAIGELSVKALRLGGEELLDKVEGRMGVAMRHCQRIRDGVFQLLPGIAREIDQSLQSARDLLEQHKVTP